MGMLRPSVRAGGIDPPSGSLLGARPLTLYPQIEVFTAQRFSSIRSGETMYYPIL